MLFFLSFFSFVIIYIILRKISIAVNLVDKPNYRKTHQGKIPLIGGLILYINLLLYLPFFEVSKELSLVILISLVLIIISAIDDAIELGVNLRLTAQLICCLLLIGTGLTITDLGAFMHLQFIKTGYFSVLFTFLCVMGLTNAFNFIDGLDGLCSSQILISLFTIIFYLFISDNLDSFYDLNIILLLFINIIFFIFFNLSNKYKIFLGDSGSLFLGFFVSWILIIISQEYENLFHPVLTIWCVSLPVLEFFSVVFRRSMLGLNPFKSDRRHLHHIFFDLGYSANKILIIFSFLGIVLNLLGIMFFYIYGPMPSLLLFILLLFSYISISSYFIKK